MNFRNTQERYGAVSQALHWSIVVLIVVQFTLATMAEDASMLRQLILLARHKSFGMLILGLAIVRLLWRLASPAPPMSASFPKWQRIGAHAIHASLYGVLFLQPITGWLMSSARNFSVSFFGLFTFPNLVSPSTPAFEFFQSFHAVLATLLLVLAGVHILAALKHHFLDRDDTLRRMLPVRLRKVQSLEDL